MATLQIQSENKPRDKPPEAAPKACKHCQKPVVPYSRFCEDHQEQALLTRKRRRIRRLDVILVLCLALGVWGYPKLKGRSMEALADYLEREDNHEPGILDKINTYLVRLTPQEAKNDKDTKRVAAALRKSLLGGAAGLTPPAADEAPHQVETSGGQLSADEAVDGLEAMTSAQHMGLTNPQLANLRKLKDGGGAPKGDAASDVGWRSSTTSAPGAPSSGAVVPIATCGNGVVEMGEECDGQALAGATCNSLGFSGDCGQDESCIHASLACLSNCTFDYSGCTAESQGAMQRFVDHGNGTANDRLTGLMWELKCGEIDCPERHNVFAALPWQGAATDWITALNEQHYAGHTDWRLPTLEELRTLLIAVPPCTAEPCASSPWPRNQTAAAGYWSSTTFSVDKTRAWAVSFRDGDVYTAEKRDALHVRAVRKGS